MDKNSFEKSCFIVTPIGNELDSIRRHIDGILDAVIDPVLKENGYEPIVAHRINLTGSINKQVINGIYNADLVIANITGLNPNVMYELAFAHSIGKKTITIAEEGVTKLPFDISTERTIFYKNDFKGSIELKTRLIDMINTVNECGDDNFIDNPIYTWLSSSAYENMLVKKLDEKTSSKDVNEENLFQYIVGRLDSMEDKINRFSINTSKYDSNNSENNNLIKSLEFICNIDSDSINRFINELKIHLRAYENVLQFTTYRHLRGSSTLILNFKYRDIDANTAESIISNIVLNAENSIKLNKIAVTKLDD